MRTDKMLASYSAGMASVINASLGIEQSSPLSDALWFDVMGIPFEVWCANGTCHGPNGYSFTKRALKLMRRERRLGLYHPSIPHNVKRVVRRFHNMKPNEAP